MTPKNSRRALLLGVAGLSCLWQPTGRAEYLFNGYLAPSFSTQYTAWDVFYAPNGGANYPDFAAPFGTYQTASQAGFTPPADASPANPSAYFDARNATITQTGASAFIISPGAQGGGNIYSFSGVTSYRLDNTSASGPLGTVAFQFQSDGTLMDFDSIRLQYTNGSGNVVSLAPGDMLREYRSSGSSFGGLTNRTALQWDLTGLGITSYRLTFNSQGSSNSFQQAVLDTAATYGAILPAARTFNAAGTVNWGASAANGNVRFTAPNAVKAVLDASHTVGELRFNTPADATIALANDAAPTPGSFALTVNTGITATAAATGNYTINTNYALGAFNVFDVAAGAVGINGVVSGAYGIQKSGAGSLTLAGNNTFTGVVGIDGGTLRLGGSNAYSGVTTILQGNLIAAADGALGTASTNIVLGADAATFTLPASTSAALTFDGARNVSRNVTLANGGYEKRIAATNTTAAGATLSGAVNFGTASNVKFTAAGAADRLTFSGALSGGVAAGTVTVDGPGTVIYAGTTAKNYANATAVNAGTLQIAAGASFTGTGAVTVNNGARLTVNGTLAGGGALNITAGVLGGSGTVSRAFTLGAGAAVSPGNSVGTINTVNETWAGGGAYVWEINNPASAASGVNPGQDLVNITGGLSLTATAQAPFQLQLRTLTLGNAPGLLAGFDPNLSYAWRLASASDGITGFGAGLIQVDASGFANTTNGTFSVSQTGSELFLNYAPVPEPSACILTGLGLAGLLAVRRRARRARVGAC